MKSFKLFTFAFFAMFLMAGGSQPLSAQDVDRTKFTDYVEPGKYPQKEMPKKKSRGSAKAMNVGARPDHINNALSMYYPPVFNQSGGSCGSAQAIGYMFTHEMNSWRNKDASFEENQYPSHFTWLFTTPGIGKMDFMINNGIPNVTTYGGRTYSNTFGYQTTDDKDFGWMQGYDKWYSAMFNRSKEFFYGPRVSRTDDDKREQLKQWLWNRWGTEGYNDGGVAGFGVASGGDWGNIPASPTNNALGVSNMKCVKAWGHTYDHGMTICGYDDRIEFDLDSNGIVGEKDKDEVGAWIICNSWGDGWCNGGFIYCPYNFTYCMLVGEKTPTLDWATELYSHRPDWEPQRTIKVTMDYSHRWELHLSAGISQDTSATIPEATTAFTHFTGSSAFDVDGVSPEVPMLGKWADGIHYEPMEFGYDLTTLGERFDKTKPLKYFFFVKTRSNGVGSGHLCSTSILNYEYDREEPVEVPFRIDTIDLKGGEATLCVSVIVPGEAINPPLNAALNNNTLTWSAPEAASLILKKYYIYNNGTRIDSVLAADKSYTVTDSKGIYSVAAVYDYKGTALVSEKSNTASNPITIDTNENKVLTLTGNSIIIPNAVAQRLNQGTIEFMIKPTKLGGTYNKMGSEDGDFFINMSASGQVSAGWSTQNSNDYATTSSSTVKVGKWQHVAVVVNNNELTIYVDGMKKKNVVSPNHTGIPEMKDFVIGLDNGEMNASIDEFRIWKTAREMKEIYGGKDDCISNPAALTDLAAYLPMNLIEHEGETKVQEYTIANHAYFDNENYENSVDNSILTGAKLNIALSIEGVGDTIIAGSPVKFSAICPLSTTSWNWDTPGAENGQYNSQTPYITYNKEGKYTVTLTITKTDGTTETVAKELLVQPAELPVIDFDITDPNKSSGEAFCFVNRSAGNGTSYTWTMTGAQVETLHTTNATAIYDIPGTYTVTLTGTNSSGSVSQSKTVNVVAAAPTPAFSVNPSSIFLGETTYLTDKSRGSIDTWTWTLDNKRHSTVINGQNSSFTPARPGIYDISLATGNEVGENSLTKKKLLYVTNADPKNALSFNGNERVRFNCPLPENSKTWTIEWWMNPTQFTGAGGFYTDNDFLKICGTANGAYKITINGSSYTSENGYVILNEWHHYAITYSYGGTVKLYRDGVLWKTASKKFVYTTGQWTGEMTISNSDTPFKGLIDEVRVWSKTMTASGLQENANNPIENPGENEKLALYYNFNQGQGNVADQTAAGNDGVREGFGPDGDAWPLALGVFTLDLDKSEAETEDVTDLYLTNYKSPFIYDEDKEVSDYTAGRFYALEQGTEESGWILQNAYTNPENGNITGVFVDKQYDYGFCVSTASYHGFNSKLDNHRAYQTVILPQGKYTFAHENDGNVNNSMKQTMAVATKGSELSTNENYKNALAYKSVEQGKEIEFTLLKETEVSLGILYNLQAYCRYNITSFSLYREDIEVLEADGETSVYESIENGTAKEAYGREGGIVISSREKRNFTIYNLNGQCVFNNEAQGVHFLPFEKGIYIVNNIKVTVR